MGKIRDAPWMIERNKKLSGKSSPHYKGKNVKRLAPQHTYYKEIMANAKYCSICNKEKKLEIHHKDGNHSNNSLSNLMLICRGCHNTIQPRTKLGRNFYNSEEYKLKQRLAHLGKKIKKVKE